MNFLCHALPYLDRPVRAGCTGVPDWLSVIDRKIRARERHAQPYLTSSDETMRQVAAGVVDHIVDDRWFHGGETFTRLTLEFAVALRDRLPGDEGFRPSFVGHILIEMLLDANYVVEHRPLVDRYYAVIESLPAMEIQRCLNEITGKPSAMIALTIQRFAELRFLYDYAADDTLLYRVNQVLGRVRLPPLPGAVAEWLPEARRVVRQHHEVLLTPPGGDMVHPSLGPGTR